MRSSAAEGRQEHVTVDIMCSRDRHYPFSGVNARTSTIAVYSATYKYTVWSQWFRRWLVPIYARRGTSHARLLTLWCDTMNRDRARQKTLPSQCTHDTTATTTTAQRLPYITSIVTTTTIVAPPPTAVVVWFASKANSNCASRTVTVYMAQ